jgi:hypothetical protein
MGMGPANPLKTIGLTLLGIGVRAGASSGANGGSRARPLKPPWEVTVEDGSHDGQTC